MQKIFNMIIATAMMLLNISCSKDDSNPVEVEGKLIIPMALIPAGSFQMGNTGAYSGRSIELPVHTVTISKAFYMSKYEVTQKQYEKVMGINPCNFKGDNLPMEEVSWHDAVAFCNALSKLERKTPCYNINKTDVTCNWDANGYRLPTEAEWEYAAKAGTTTDFYSGSLIHSETMPLDSNLDKIGWYSGNSVNKAQLVGQKRPNAFGLYDMCGNVYEWCWNWWSYYPSTAVTDPTGPPSGTYRMRRGGSWYTYAYYCRTASRFFDYPGPHYYGIGFRIVRLDK